MERSLAAGLVALVLAAPAAAQEADLGGQVRPRFEIRDPVAGAGTVEFTSMRTRASLRVALDGAVTAFVQLQDVRVFGEEASTLGDFSADGLDLHQGWVELGDAEASDWSVRVGRQEAVYGGERLVGAVNWTQQGRSFDGVRARYRPSADAVVDGLAFRISDASVTGVQADRSLYGVYSTFEASGDLDLFGLLDTQNGVTVDDDIVTLGARWVSGSESLTWRLEGAYQLGERTAGPIVSDRSAFMLGVRVGTQMNEDLEATLWYDYLSGDDDPADDEIGVFNTLYATNHKFYGYMDLFLDIPTSTNGRGLQDAALKTQWQLADDRTVGADLHTFLVAAGDGLDSGHIGTELDLTYRWVYMPGVDVTGGLSYFVAGDAWSTGLGNPDENQVWGYLMMNVAF
ncbi:MAG: alginate export family protein [Candidatus Longimicrobiales bacterium M2_2A_002]